MEKIKILAVFGSLQRGGAETMYMNLYRHIDHSRYQIDFLVKDHADNGYEEEVRACGAKILYVKSAKKVGVRGYVNAIKQAILSNGSYAVVHSHVNIMSGLVLLAAKRAGVPIRIAHSHNNSFAASPHAQKIGKLLIRLFANRRMACSENAGKALFLGKPFMVLPNGIDMDKFLLNDANEKEDIRQRLKFDADKKYIIHIGRFDTQKNHAFLLRMFAALHKSDASYRLLLLGEGRMFDEMKALARDLGVERQVMFMGSVPNVNDNLRAADVFVLPSLFEGLPVSAVEAQCASLTCLLSDKVPFETDLGLGLTEFIPLEEKAWVDAILRAETSRILEARMIRQGFSKRGMDVKGNVDTLLRAYIDEK